MLSGGALPSQILRRSLRLRHTQPLAASQQRRHAASGFFSGLKKMVGGSADKREFPSAEHRGQDEVDTSSMSGLELSKHQMEKQRALEAELLAQREASGEGGEKVAIGEEYKASLYGVPMVANTQLKINADGVQTFGGNEAWAATNTRALPGLPSREDFGLAAPGEGGAPAGKLGATELWDVLRCKEEAEALQRAGAPPASQEQAALELEQLCAEVGLGGGAEQLGWLAPYSTVVVLQNERGKRIGARSVPPSVRDGSAAGWSVAEEDGAAALIPQALSTETRETHSTDELTDAQRAARGLALKQQQQQPPSADSAPGLPWQRHVDEGELDGGDGDSAPPPASGEGERVTVRLVRSGAGLGLEIGPDCAVLHVVSGSQAEGAGICAADVVVGCAGMRLGCSDAEPPSWRRAEGGDRDGLLACIGQMGLGEQFSMELSRPAAPTQAGAGTAPPREAAPDRAAGVFWEGDAVGGGMGLGGAAEDTALAAALAQPGAFATESGLVFCEVAAGDGGRHPAMGDTVRVHYEGRLADGTVFDSSVLRGEAAEFLLSGVIAGWAEGLALMSVGSKAVLTIPSRLGYGAAGMCAPPLPWCSTRETLCDELQ